MPVINITTNEQLDTVMRQTAGDGKTLLLMFTASWCGPCKRIKPLVIELSSKYIRQISVGLVDVDEAEEVSERYEISSMPSFVFVRGANVVYEASGVDATKLENLIKFASGISHPDLVE